MPSCAEITGKPEMTATVVGTTLQKSWPLNPLAPGGGGNFDVNSLSQIPLRWTREYCIWKLNPFAYP